MKYGKKDNEIAQQLRTKSRPFIQTKEWRALRLKVLDTYGRKCMRCGYATERRSHISVDHIKPRKTHPELALDFNNLQVLCSRCNKLKGNKHATDYRQAPLPYQYDAKK